ncbi:MAG: hypothetical protein ACRD5H_08080 [Nitrososphaerales archaeon]
MPGFSNRLLVRASGFLRSHRDGLVTYFVPFHLALVICGALNFAPWIGGGFFNKSLVMYTDVTGARYSYGFFAPDVPNQALAVVTSENESGEKTVEAFGAGTREIDHRITTMMSFFTVVDTDNLHAASLAGYAFDHHPEAKKVTVSLRCYTIPSMEEYRQGKRPTADEYYKGVYVRKSEYQATRDHN